MPSSTWGVADDGASGTVIVGGAGARVASADIAIARGARAASAATRRAWIAMRGVAITGAVAGALNAPQWEGSPQCLPALSAPLEWEGSPQCSPAHCGA